VSLPATSSLPLVPPLAPGSAGALSAFLFSPSFASLSTAPSSTPVLNVDSTGQPLTFWSAIKGPFGPQWAVSYGDELIKLVETTHTLCPVHVYLSSATYYNRVIKGKWSASSLLTPGHLRSLDTDVLRRVRGTAGGDRLHSSCPPSTNIASLPALNITLNAVVSEDAFFGSVDLTDFYLGTPILHHQYIKVYVDSYPPAVLPLLPFIKADASEKRFCVFRVEQTMYGLKEAASLVIVVWSPTSCLSAL
jgi:hypothetical protein